MNEFLNNISDWIVAASDHVCGYPEFLLLIGGGIFLFFYSGAVSIRHLPASIRALRHKQSNNSGKTTGQISSIQALMSAIAATVGMGNIAGVAIALTVGGPGVIFWMWVSAIVGMSTKFFEGTLAIMYKGRDTNGELQGGPMYMMVNGLGPKWKPMAVAFSCFGLIGTLCFMQANQLVESVTTVFTTPAGIENTLFLRFIMGVVITIIVGTVILGGIGRIAKLASRIVPTMVVVYFIMVAVIMVLNIDKIPGIFASIFQNAFSMKAGFGAFAFVALTGARRAAYVNEAGIGTASMMHGASKNTDPIREGLVAMIAPAIDSGIVCTLTAIPILIAGNYVGVTDVKGLFIALGAFGQLLPFGQYFLMAIVFFFAFSTVLGWNMFGKINVAYLFGKKSTVVYTVLALVFIFLGTMMSNDLVWELSDMFNNLMVIPNAIALFALTSLVVKHADDPNRIPGKK